MELFTLTPLLSFSPQATPPQYYNSVIHHLGWIQRSGLACGEGMLLSTSLLIWSSQQDSYNRGLAHPSVQPIANHQALRSFPGCSHDLDTIHNI